MEELLQSDLYKAKLLEMMSWFHQYCVENELRYYVIDGTMLGAARHNGFIPWDDDIDVGMPREDYVRLEALMGNNIYHDKYILETPYTGNKDFTFPYSKIYDTTTTVVEIKKHNIKRGIYLDVFPLDGIGPSLKAAMANYRPISFLLNTIASRTLKIRAERQWYKNLAISLLSPLPESLLNSHKLISTVNSISAKRSFDDEVYVGSLFSAWRSREIMERAFYGDPTLYQFEGIEVYGVENPNSYLSHLYGDWKTLPPINKRHSGHDKEHVDLFTPYIASKDDIIK